MTFASRRQRAGSSIPVDDDGCSIERAAEIFGDAWTLMIVREILVNGTRRFSELESTLGIATNVLASRLQRLAQVGIIEQREYQDRGARTRMCYQATRSGRDVIVILTALAQWEHRHAPGPHGSLGPRLFTTSSLPVELGFVTNPGLLTPLSEIGFDRGSQESRSDGAST